LLYSWKRYIHGGTVLIVTEIKNADVYFGNGALDEAEQKICGLGGKALVVSGAHAADISGAYRDICILLEKHGIGHARYAQIRENPSVTSCYEGAALGREEDCDFVIAVGGGSAMDAGKAAAFYLTNPEAGKEDIFHITEDMNRPAPLVAVPTTAGTGSEANRYSVLTEDGGLKKHTYKSSLSYPDISAVCPKYTYSLPEQYTLSTALDAFAHSIESYLSPKSTDHSRKLASEAAGLIWNILKREKAPLDIDEGGREDLSKAAMLAGAAIDVTGTGFPHPMGYGLTLGYGVPHGSACAVFEDAYIRYNMITAEGRRLIAGFCGGLEVSPEELGAKLVALSGVRMHISREKAEELISRVENASNFSNSPYILSRGEMLDIFKRQFKN
jgi:alcohol dehydrogenase